MGMRADHAAETLNLGLEETRRIIEGAKDHHSWDDEVLRHACFAAMHIGLTELHKIAKAGPRKTKVEVRSEEGLVSVESYESTDLEASKELIKFALTIRKMIGVGKFTESMAKGLALSKFGENWDVRD